ncbi:MAG: hypothetical protein D6748_13705 [Calditrichaeota bacterium]|nr:MAG: hypothetical protein D6748_13705 [Calditrichota bacterium]
MVNKKISGKEVRTRLVVIILALIFWLVVKMNKQYDYAVNIPLHIINTNQVMCLKYPIPAKVRVEFTGRGIDLLRLSLYDTYYEVDISDVGKNMVLDFSQHPEYVKIPDELKVSVRSILRPHQINFELDECRSKYVPVQFSPQIRTVAGFTLVDVIPTPDSILVNGPASFVDTLHTLHLIEKDYQEVDKPFREILPIRKYTEFHCEYHPEKVEVFFDVQRLAEKEIRDVPVNIINVPKTLEVVPLPSLVRLYVKGGEKVLADATAKDFQVEIDFSRDWHPGTTRVKAHIKTDLKVMYMESYPAEFELIVQKKKRRK